MRTIAAEGFSEHTKVVREALDELRGQGGGTLVIRAGLYRIREVRCPSDVRLIGEPGATVRLEDGARGLLLDSAERVRIEGLRFDGSGQQTGSCINGANARDIEIERCEFAGGFLGVSLTGVTRGAIRYCRGSRFRRWPFLVTGCDGFEYIGNESHHNDYDGLKLAGVDRPHPPNRIRNVRVSGNVCFANRRDGFDLAGNDVENVQIYGNLFYDNVLQGMDVKTVYQSSYMRRVLVHDNQCLYNANGQMNCQNGIGSACAIRVYDNEIVGHPSGDSYGIRFVGQGAGAVVARNTIGGVRCGIRLIDANEAEIRSNRIEAHEEGVWLELQRGDAMSGNVIADNDIRSFAHACIRIGSDRITRSVIRENRLRTVSGLLRIVDSGAETVMLRNEAGLAAAEPTGPATAGELFWNAKPQPGAPVGWIAVTTGETPEFRPIGLLDR